MVLLWLVIDVEVALPFQLGAVGEMVQSVTHFCFFSLVSCVLVFLDMQISVSRKGGRLRRYFNQAVIGLRNT